jgi:ligand-binding sensor domain-containing protein
VRPDIPTTVWVCGDAGVYASADEGMTWMNLTRNLPRVMVVDLVFHQAKKWLVAATYGRSVYRLDVQ